MGIPIAPVVNDATVKARTRTKVITDPNHPPYPNDPNYKFIGGAWVKTTAPGFKPTTTTTTPNQRKKTVAAYLADKKRKAEEAKGTPTAPDKPSWNALDGMPGMYDTGEYPSLDPNTLPDGSAVPNTPAVKFVNGRAQLLDPGQFRSQTENSFQPLIDAITGQKGRLQGGIGQANGMLDKAFGGVKDASLAGANTITANNEKSNQTLTQLAANLASVAGGDPTAAAAIGQAAVNQTAANKDQSDLGARISGDTAAAAEKDLALAKLGYKSSTDSKISDLATAAGQAQSESKQKGLGAFEEALGFNSSQQTAQTSRAVAQQEARLAARVAGAQATGLALDNESKRAALALQKHGAEVNDYTNKANITRQQWTDATSKWSNKNLANQVNDTLAKGADATRGAELALVDSGARNAAAQEILNPVDGQDGLRVNPTVAFDSVVKTMQKLYTNSSDAAIHRLAEIWIRPRMEAWNNVKQHAKNQQKFGHTYKWVNGKPQLVKS